MAAKSAVSSLAEYCAKNKLEAPTFEWIDSSDEGFICRATLADFTADGQGRSKRDAKHAAALHVIKLMSSTHPELVNTEQKIQDVVEDYPSKDMVMLLRDYCVQHEHPLPTFEIVQQAGTPDAPEFTALCTIASIRRYGVSDKKKDARQRAAREMFNVIATGNKVEHQLQVMSKETTVEEIEYERFKKFKTYRELTESSTPETFGVKLCDRHNYFCNFYPSLKQEAFAVLNSANYESKETQVYDVLKALKLTASTELLPNENSADNPMVFMQLNCEYNVCFAGIKEEIYDNILDYFRVMLT